MRLRVDVGVDAEADWRLLAQPAGNLIESVEFGRRFEVEAENAGIDGEFHFLDGLADAGEYDFLRIAAGSQRPLEFAARNNIKSSALAGEDIQDAKIGIRLDGKTDERVGAGEFLLVLIQCRFKRGA